MKIVGTDGDDDQADRVGLFRRCDRETLQQRATGNGDQDRRADRKRQRPSKRNQRGGHHAAQHQKIALREIDHAARVVNDGETERGKRIDRADRQPRKQILKKDRHRAGLINAFSNAPLIQHR